MNQPDKELPPARVIYDPSPLVYPIRERLINYLKLLPFALIFTAFALMPLNDKSSVDTTDICN